MGPGLARLLLLVAAAMWGMTFVANHELLVVLDPAQIVVIRFVGVSLLFGAVLVVRPRLRPRFSRRQWVTMIVLGVLAVPGAQLALINGQRFLSPAMSGLVVAAGPAFAALLAVVFLGERLGAVRTGGIVLAFGGAATVILFATGTGTELTVRNPWGAALVALAQLCWAAFTVLSKHIVDDHHSLTAISVAVILGTVLMLPSAPAGVEGLPGIGPAHWLWFLHLIIPGTVIPYVIWFTSLRHLQANETVVFMFLIPLFAVGWSALILGERPAPIGLLGGVGIVVGVLLTQRFSRVPSRPRPAVEAPPEVQAP